MPINLTALRDIFTCSRCPLWKCPKDGEKDSCEPHSKDGDQEADEDTEPGRYFSHKSTRSESNWSSPPPTDESLGIYKALWAFEARSEEEMSFVKDDLFRVTERSGDWLTAHKLVNGEVVASGVVPCNYLVKGETLDDQPWYFGKLNRFEAQNLLLTSGNPEGAFLVRHSEKDEVGHVLSVKVDDKVKHFKILQGEEGLFYVELNQTFTDLEALVKYYRGHSLSVVAQITEACARRKPEPQDLPSIPEDDWELPKSEFTLEQQLGSGYFADVYRGKWKGTVNVAIKILKNNDMLNHREFQLETQMLKQLRHRHLICLFAISTDSAPFYIITELMEKGNLLSFLRGPEGQHMDFMSLTDMATQVSDAMAYLESENSIHRDLAARNVLVGVDNICKVADFGLARVIKEPFYLSEDKKIPYKWSAPEAISHGRFSNKSDVWSFGILLYEIFTYGGSPYPTYANYEVFQRITEGYRMPCPKTCPKHIYDIMLMCWSYSPEERPDFQELKSLLDTDRYNEWTPESCVDNSEAPGGSNESEPADEDTWS
ncbi:protein-tyrosine kinase 6-like [Clupea harengus]|uniref:Tyrosine-protein kinase n=1 Tax=Clupea harengus TaxID=7950 RepID=A0A6P8FF00_CLUHA|nr:protein-tyrosine kinase 6-like [Clupea harengus]